MNPTRFENGARPTDRVTAAYARIAEVDRPEVWIALRDEAEVVADAAAIEGRLAAGEVLPLAGLLVAVKDNIDVAGLPTTAGCPEFAYVPTETAAAVERLTAAGAIVLGKTNLDQFATGLVGTRSPYGAVRNAHHPDLISGGSSSGSAVAVALGIADIGLGTDTAGSGRIPAAFHGLVGIKATLGIIPTHGVVPACADYDALTVFAATLDLATAAAAAMSGPDQRDPRSRTWPADVRLAAPRVPRLAVPDPAQLDALSADYRIAFDKSVDAALEAGFKVEPVDLTALLEAARLLYDGAIVAERYAAVGEFLRSRPAGADPTVSAIIDAAAATTGPAFAHDLDTLARTRATTAVLFESFDAMLLPTATEHPTLAEVAADPFGINRRLGTFTNFCNLLDLAAIAIPGTPTPAGTPFGVMIVVPAFADQIAVDLAARLQNDSPATILVDRGIRLAVFGAHLRGQPLHWQLEELGARFEGGIHTTDAYRLTALDTVPRKPGLVRTAPGDGLPIAGELYHLSEAALGRFLATLPAPMALTAITLADGRTVTGFTATHDATAAATDITEYRSWPAYLAHTNP
ncbi:allophanate hydrolase [Nocardia seriolae]|uniref:allophanate hydrolase n=1 Tax=Nocardia seriolae TaxID=37332 RepID=UPI00051A8A2B|nr:allophanate hydrolase [Nocardia seriolae]MTJ64391.1 allophanate hydrolase [Nocardia seriolae]MTJ75357.1 allophanate hydrolase [Nocardia seriolae]MTJ87615.1 allophanate hydrolase [Nocardia seriolae]MTK31608.1 allophanate hydrolase [Nocardia seriolae]MTK42256.1 allophanate hydrolase [Nocardia seriolae]